MIDKIKNKELRELFFKRFPDSMKLAESIGIHATDISSWKTGKRDLGEKRLKKIEDFLNKNK